MNNNEESEEEYPTPWEGKIFWVNGSFWKIIAGGEDTENKYGLMDVTVLPKNGAKSHIHSREDEVFYVIDGQFDLQYGENSIRATNGFHLFMKRGIPHSFKNIGNNEGKILIMFIPAGCEKLYEELGIPVTDLKAFVQPYTFHNFVKIFQLLRKYGIEPKIPL